MAAEPAIRLILASASPARHQLLIDAGLRFEVRPAEIEEPQGAGFTSPRAFVEHVAWQKACAVAHDLVTDQSSPLIILAADTVGWIDGRPVGKPTDESDARRILKRLAGTQHELWTGVCLWRKPDDVQISWQEMSKVAMRAMNDPDLNAYLESRQWQGCSGAYAIQEGDDPYVRVISGSRTNVIGLPMETLKRMLRLGATF
jgi:septum formation protein